MRDPPRRRGRRRGRLDRGLGPEDGLYEPGHAAERVAAAVEASVRLGFPFTLTARAENHIRGNPDLDDTIAACRPTSAPAPTSSTRPGCAR